MSRVLVVVPEGNDAASRAFLPALRCGLPGWPTATAALRDPGPKPELSVPNPLAIRRALRGADGLVVGADLSAARRGAARTAAVLTATARAYDVPVAFLGVAAGAVPDARARLVRTLAKRADLFLVRDRASAKVLVEIGVPAPLRLAPDPSWVLLDGTLPPAARGRRVVIAGGPDDDGRLVRSLSPALARLTAEGLHVEVQPWTGQDAGLARALLAGLDGRARSVPAPDDLARARVGFAGAALVVALRYHSLAAAASAGAPVIAMAGERSVLTLAEELGVPAVPPGAPAASVLAAVHAALDGPPADPKACSAMVGGAQAAFRLLRVLLSRGRTADSLTVAGLRLEPLP